MAYVQKNNPFVKTRCGRRYSPLNNMLMGDFKSPFEKADPRRTIGKGKNFNPVSKDKSATGGAAGGGMTEKGVAEYAKRRKSFCARSKSWTSERGKAARRRWNC